MSEDSKKLKKELGVKDIFALAAGTSLSAGFFLLPGFAASEYGLGSSVVIAYLVAVFALIPVVFSIAELSTAMPRAGGAYYFIDRSLGPLFGTVGGIGSWLALVLKSGFALIGMGFYIALFFPQYSEHIVPISILASIALGLINWISAKSSGEFQKWLVGVLVLILAVFVSGGVTKIEPSNLSTFFDFPAQALLSTSAMVYISYAGITKVTSLSEEVKDPERTIPLGMFYALGVSVLVYGLGTLVMVGVIPLGGLLGNPTLAADAAQAIFGETGLYLISLAAIAAFISVANAGILTASRYPLAMSRDDIIPRVFAKISHNGTPIYSLILTVVFISLILVFLDPAKIVKLASAFQLFVFAILCFSVIVMRESRIEGYDPGYRSPFYPWMQIAGVVSSLWLFSSVGISSKLFTAVVVVVCMLWYRLYIRKKLKRDGAIFHMFENLGRSRYGGLDTELRGILKEKGLRKDDPFDRLMAGSAVIDLENKDGVDFETVVNMASEEFGRRIKRFGSRELERRFIHGAGVGITPVTEEGVALPHLRLDGIDKMEIVMVRSCAGVQMPPDPESPGLQVPKARALFFLISPSDDTNLHLRILARMASIVEAQGFFTDWLSAAGEDDLRAIFTRSEQIITVNIGKWDSAAHSLTGKPLKDSRLPQGCLVALVRRGGQTVVPGPLTILEEGDSVTFVGEPEAIEELKTKYLRGAD
ncbi:MAG: amino acid permease [Candidatus Mycalebacterium zealandia]|nr:MAG: amino acid permease [Candidatus Mycalebacterium zealandia]